MKYYDKKRAAHGWWRVGLGILWIILMLDARANGDHSIVSRNLIVCGIRY